VRGVDCFDIVWENVAKYVSINADKVMVKYIVMPDYCELHELNVFAKRCASTGVTNVGVIQSIIHYGVGVLDTKKFIPCSFFVSF